MSQGISFARLRRPGLFGELLMWIGLEGLYQRWKVEMVKQGVMLSREDFLEMGVGALISPIAMLELMRTQTPFRLITNQAPAQPGARALGNRKVMGLRG